jgi:hypothetical protein
LGGFGAAVQACGGSDATVGNAADASSSSDGSAGDGGASGDGGSGGDGSSQGDGGGGACAAPSDSTKAALCVAFTPEAIQFIAADPNLDGKGLLAFDVHDTPTPDLADGGSVPALAFVSYPALDGGADAGEFDLGGPLPIARFDNLPAEKVYPRVVFIDTRTSPNAINAGWWLGGYDFANGIQANVPIRGVTLTAGAGTQVTIDLHALRRLHVTLTRSATAIGNAQGEATVVATPDQVPGTTSKIYGLGKNACAKMTGNLSAEVNGFVIGKGPYYAVAALDDFGIGGSVPPGSLVSLEYVDGGIRNPASTLMTYAANAYQVSHQVDLDLAIPYADAGADPVSCP